MPLLSTWLGHVDPASTYCYLTGAPELLELIADRLDRRGGRAMTALAPLLEAFFTNGRSGNVRRAHTVAPYRDSFCLLLRFAQQRTSRRPHQLASRTSMPH